MPEIDKTNIPKFNVQAALALRCNGATLQQIADVYGLTRQQISNKISKLLPAKKSVREIEENFGRMLIMAKNRAIEIYLTLTPDEQKQMLMRRGLVDFGILYDKCRLEQNLSTANIATVSTDIEELRSFRRAERAENEPQLHKMPVPHGTDIARAPLLPQKEGGNGVPAPL